MKTNLDFIRINDQSIIPKYKQLATGIETGLGKGFIAKNQILPSLHELCTRLNVSKKTAEKAYNYLKTKGLIISAKGKGFAIAAEY